MVGGINQDVVVRVARRPRPGETVVGEGPSTSAGGKGANMAVAAAHAAGEVVVALCAAVGDDAAGRAQLAALAASGVETGHVATRSDVGTGVALITVTPDGENDIVVGTGANATLTDAEVAAACAGVDVVLAQTEVGPDPVTAAARAAAGSGARLVLSPAPVVDLPDDVLALADPLVVNVEEAGEILGGPADDLAEAVLARTGARSVVVTLGADGAALAAPDGVRRLPSPRVEVVDTTGAGDVLAGTLAARLAGGDDLATALEAAVTAAARAVQHPGARPE